MGKGTKIICINEKKGWKKLPSFIYLSYSD